MRQKQLPSFTSNCPGPRWLSLNANTDNQFSRPYYVVKQEMKECMSSLQFRGDKRKAQYKFHYSGRRLQKGTRHVEMTLPQESKLAENAHQLHVSVSEMGWCQETPLGKLLEKVLLSFDQVCLDLFAPTFRSLSSNRNSYTRHTNFGTWEADVDHIW
ncbi:hypothetical protein SUGI_0093270 [Cryptomeria japonica]|nr:hypothetical protein SUGI_0093270 [Cryptomeria japonica]